MPDASYFAQKAARCRELAKIARVPEIGEQLRMWAEEFEAMAQAFSVTPAEPAAPANPVETAVEITPASIIGPETEGIA